MRSVVPHVEHEVVDVHLIVQGMVVNKLYQEIQGDERPRAAHARAATATTATRQHEQTLTFCHGVGSLITTAIKPKTHKRKNDTNAMCKECEET